MLSLDLFCPRLTQPMRNDAHECPDEAEKSEGHRIAQSRYGE
jgi:hypothetical protein